MGQTWAGGQLDLDDERFLPTKRKINEIGQHGGSCRHISIKAPPDIEEATFMKSIACDIRCGQIEKLKDYLVIIVNVSKFKQDEKYLPCQVILGNTFGDINHPDMIKSYEYMIKHPIKVAFIFYELDKMPCDFQRKRPLISYFKRSTVDVVLFNILSGHLFPMARIISMHSDAKMNFHVAIQPDQFIIVEGSPEDYAVCLVNELPKDGNRYEGSIFTFPESLKHGTSECIARAQKGKSEIMTDLPQKRQLLIQHLIQCLKTECNEVKRVDLYLSVYEGKTGSTPIVHSAIKDIDVSEVTLAQHDIQAIGYIIKLAKHLTFLNLRRCGLEDYKVEILAKLAIEGNCKVGELEVSCNSFGAKGMTWLAKMVKHFQVRSLRIWSCGLESIHLRKLIDGTVGVQLNELDISSNMFGVDGMFRLGKLVRQCGVKILELRNCEIQTKHILKFLEGVGDAKLTCLNLDDWYENPNFNSRLLALLSCVQVVLSLRGWQVDEKELEKIQSKLNKTYPIPLTVYLSHGVELKAAKPKLSHA